VCENAKLDSADRSYRVTRRGEQWPQGVKTQRLKKEVRKDVDDHSRRRLWLTVTTAGALLEKQPNFYSEILQDMFGSKRPESFTIPHQFTPCCQLQYFHLTSVGQQTAHKILNVLAYLHPDVESCSLLAPIVIIMLHYMDEDQCFACAAKLLESKGERFLELSYSGCVSSQRSFTDVARARAAHSFRLLASIVSERIQKKVAVFDEVMYAELKGWQTWIFSFLPFPLLVRICDSFFIEGLKVFFRVGLAILIHFCKDYQHIGIMSLYMMAHAV
jgi:hypothetical protein